VSIVFRGYSLEAKSLDGETQNSPPSSATLRVCGAVPPHSLHAFLACMWTMRVEMQESKLEEDRETCKVWNLKLSFAIAVIKINNDSR